MRRKLGCCLALIWMLSIFACACQKTEEADATLTSTYSTSIKLSTTTVDVIANAMTTTSASEATTTATTTTTTTTKVTTTTTTKVTTTKKPTTTTNTTTTTTKKAIKNPEYGTVITINPYDSGIEFDTWGWKALRTTFTWKVDEYGGWWAESSTTSMNSEEVREWDKYGLDVMNSLAPTHKGTPGESYTYTVWVWLEK